MFEGVSSDAMTAYRRLEELTGGPLRVNSAYRSPEHNAKVGGAKNSQHTHGNAFDIDVSGMSPQERNALAAKAYEAGFRGFGFYDNALHFDVGPERAWGPSYSRDSIPGWASSVPTGQGGAPAPTENRLAGFEDKFARYSALQGLMPRANLLNPQDYMT